jgi:hypothetical protein
MRLLNNSLAIGVYHLSRMIGARVAAKLITALQYRSAGYFTPLAKNKILLHVLGAPPPPPNLFGAHG